MLSPLHISFTSWSGNNKKNYGKSPMDPGCFLVLSCYCVLVMLAEHLLLFMITGGLTLHTLDRWAFRNFIHPVKGNAGSYSSGDVSPSLHLRTWWRTSSSGEGSSVNARTRVQCHGKFTYVWGNKPRAAMMTHHLVYADSAAAINLCHREEPRSAFRKPEGPARPADKRKSNFREHGGVIHEEGGKTTSMGSTESGWPNSERQAISGKQRSK